MYPRPLRGPADVQFSLFMPFQYIQNTQCIVKSNKLNETARKDDHIK